MPLTGNKTCRLTVTVVGPPGSRKTTILKRIEVLLKDLGLQPEKTFENTGLTVSQIPWELWSFAFTCRAINTPVKEGEKEITVSIKGEKIGSFKTTAKYWSDVTEEFFSNVELDSKEEFPAEPNGNSIDLDHPGFSKE